MKTKDKKRHNNCISEIKCKEKNKYYKEIKIIINSKNNKKNSHSMCYYLIKCFSENKFQSLTNDDLLNYIINIYENNPKDLVTTNTEKEFKNRKGIKSVYTKLINKNIIFIYNSKEKKYKLNEKDALNYLQSLNGHSKYDRHAYKTPRKLISKTKRLLTIDEERHYLKSPQSSSKNILSNKIKREKIENEEECSEEENIKIKKEEINIKEEKYKSSEEKITIKKEEIKIKEEPKKIKEEQKIKEENTEEDDLNLDKIIDLFNAKLYDDNFYHSFAEQGLYEQLQEKLEILFKKYNENMPIKDEGVEIVNEIKNIKELLEDLNKKKEEYDNLINEYVNIKRNINLYAEILKFKYNEIKNAKIIMENEDFKNYEMDSESKNIYDFYKEKHDLVYQELISNHQKIKNIMEISENTKDSIKNKFIKIVEKIDANNFDLELKNDLKELAKNIKLESYSFLIGEIVAEQTFQKYDKYIKELDEKANNLINSSHC